MTITNPALERGYGMLKTLEEQITPAEVRRVERLGYIENAISPKGATWKLSVKGRRMRKNLSRGSSFATRWSDFFFKHVLRYNVSLERRLIMCCGCLHSLKRGLHIFVGRGCLVRLKIQSYLVVII